MFSTSKTLEMAVVAAFVLAIALAIYSTVLPRLRTLLEPTTRPNITRSVSL